MPETMTYTGTLTVTSCGVCHMRFAIPEDLEEELRASSRKFFWCPAGHELHYVRSETQRLKEQLATAERQRELAQRSASAAWSAAGAARDQAEAAERSARAYRGHATRLRNRVKAGVCPVDGCKRHFADLASHIESKHPGYATEQQADE